jgi:integrase
MASVFKAKGAKKYTILYFDENGDRRKRQGYTDKGETMKLAVRMETRADKIRDGSIDPRDEAYAASGAQTLLTHVEAWTESLRSRGTTAQHVKLHSSRALRVIALLKGAKLADIEAPKPATNKGVATADKELRRWVASARIADLTSENVQRALARLTDEGRSLQTASHHRNAIKSFAKWMYETHRTRENVLRGVAGFNVKADPRHERRTISVDEMRKLVEVAEAGEPFKSMTGPMRALCYRLAVASGLRYSEIRSITPESFDWRTCTVTIRAAYAKNGQTIALPMAPELAIDLKAYVATLESRRSIFPLPHDKGAAMLRGDLESAGIPYQDASGHFFDFHSLRCELATLADLAGVSPRVTQKMMRHSKLEMTGRYTRPRAVDMESAASMLPSLKPTEDENERLAATGTDPKVVSISSATQNATLAVFDAQANRRKSNDTIVTGEGLEPSTNGLTYLIGFRRPS